MPKSILDGARTGFHRLLPEKTRTKLYFLAPESVKRLWDQFGIDQASKFSQKNILFTARLFWFHEPSAATIQRWLIHASRLNHEFRKLAHDMQHDVEATQHEQELRYTQVPADVDYVDYAYRLFLHRAPDDKELNDWLERLQETEWTLGGFVSSFEKSKEYRLRLRTESEPHLVELNKFKVYVRLGDYFTSGPIAHTKEYEPEIMDLIGAIVRPGDFVIDVGANVGCHALNMAVLVGGQGKVFAFEPRPGNCDLIKLSIEANNFTNLELFPDAAGNAAGTIEILVEGDNTNARINSNPDHDSLTAKRFTVRVVKIDDCLQDIPRLRFVKIDVEGAEPMVIDGMSNLISRFMPVLLFEFYPDFIRLTSQCDPQKFLDQIIEYGYKLRVIGQDGNISEVLRPSQVMRLPTDRGRTHVDVLALPEDFKGFPTL